MKFDFNRKYNTIAAYVIICFAVCLLLVIAAFRFESFRGVISQIFGVLSPILWGIVIAYLLNPLMKVIERLFTRWFCKKKPHKRLMRALSITLTVILALASLSALSAAVLPELADSLSSIFNLANISTYLSNAEIWIKKTLENNPQIYEYVGVEFEHIRDDVINYVTSLQPQIKELVSGLTKGAMSFLIGLKDFVLGFIVSVYLLASKEVFQAQAKKMLYAFFSKRACINILSVTHKVDSTFSRFISGKSLDSLIIGMLCFIGMSIMKMNAYAVLISVIVGITNMIPFFGPFIGAIPSAILILFSQPKMTIPFIIFILFLQQFDGNILGPKILGDSTGLPAFWVMFAIFIGGGLFGFIGMLTCVPIFAVIYMLVRQLVENSLKNKNLPTSTSAYYHGKRVHSPNEGKTMVVHEVIDIPASEDFSPIFKEDEITEDGSTENKPIKKPRSKKRAERKE